MRLWEISCMRSSKPPNWPRYLRRISVNSVCQFSFRRGLNAKPPRSRWLAVTDNAVNRFQYTQRRETNDRR